MKDFTKVIQILSLIGIFSLVLIGGGASAKQMDFDVFVRLQIGMTEEELLSFAGRPDREINLDTTPRTTSNTVKQLVYLPGPDEEDPHLTLVSIQSGKVINLERIKLFSPAP